jgi:hypothetical protein
MGLSLGKILLILHEDFLDYYILVFIIEFLDLFDEPFGIKFLGSSVGCLKLNFVFLGSLGLQLVGSFRTITTHVSLFPAAETSSSCHQFAFIFCECSPCMDMSRGKIHGIWVLCRTRPLSLVPVLIWALLLLGYLAIEKSLEV